MNEMVGRHYQNSVSHIEYKLTARLKVFIYIISLTPHKIPKEASIIYLHLQVEVLGKSVVSASLKTEHQLSSLLAQWF